MGGPFPRTSGNRGTGYLAIELLNVPGRRRPMAGPGLVAKADTLQKLLCGHRGPQRDQLLAQGLVFAAPHLVELDLVHHVPLRTVRGFGGLHAWELPEVACKDEDGNPVCRLPHLDNALEVLLGELGDLVDRDHVVLRQTVHYFHRILVEEEGAGTGVHVRVRVLAPDPGCLLGRGQCIQHSASLSQAPADAFVDHSSFASAWRSSRCLRPVRLSFLYDVVILRVVRCLPRRLGPVQQLADAFLQSFLPLVQSYISLQLPRPVIPFVQFTMIGGRREQFDLSANPSVSKVHSFSLFPVSRAEAPLPCKIPLYNLDSESNLDMRSILNPLNHTIHSLCDQAVVQSGLGQS